MCYCKVLETFSFVIYTFFYLVIRWLEGLLFVAIFVVHVVTLHYTSRPFSTLHRCFYPRVRGCICCTDV